MMFVVTSQCFNSVSGVVEVIAFYSSPNRLTRTDDHGEQRFYARRMPVYFCGLKPHGLTSQLLS